MHTVHSPEPAHADEAGAHLPREEPACRPCPRTAFTAASHFQFVIPSEATFSRRPVLLPRVHGRNGRGTNVRSAPLGEPLLSIRMTPAPSDPGPAAPPPLDHEALVRLLREELVKTQLIVLDLNDRILEKETDKADAIAILARVELVLEQKIDYITELDRLLNAQISDLRAQLEASRNEARDCARAAAELSVRLGNSPAPANPSAPALEQTRAAASAVASAFEQRTRELADTRAQLDQTARKLAERDHELAVERHRLNKVFRSSLWRLGRPWRALFGPKL